MHNSLIRRCPFLLKVARSHVIYAGHAGHGHGTQGKKVLGQVEVNAAAILLFVGRHLQHLCDAILNAGVAAL